MQVQIRSLFFALLLATIPIAATGTNIDHGGDFPGEFSYPQGSPAYDEIHRTLPDMGLLQRFDGAMAAAGRDAKARRAAQLEILGLVRLAPLELFRQLRAERPVLELPDLQMYLVTRDGDVRQILNNPTVFSVRDYRDRMEPVVGGYMLNQDSHPYYNIEEKPWMRTLLVPSDYPRVRAIARQATAEGIRSGTQPDGRLDVVAYLGRDVPLKVVQQYFGFRAPREEMLDWSFKTQDSFFHNVAYVRGVRGLLIRWFGLGGEAVQKSQVEARRVHQAAFAAGKEMQEFLQRYLSEDREQILAEDTILSRMLRGDDELAYPKDAARLRSNIMGGLVGAVETSNAAIVQSLNQLLKRPAILARAREAALAVGDDEAIEESRFARFVWEALRFHPINPFVVRYVEQDTVIGTGDQAVRLKSGRRVLVATHSAMHDPRTVKDPDAFDIDRPYRDREMNLGFGMHRCLGDHVAEVMVPEVLRQLLLLPGLARDGDLDARKTNQGIDFGARGSFPERYVVQYGR